jgi:hypothetical protein
MVCFRYNQEKMVEWLAQHGSQTASETVHLTRPLDLTRPGATRMAVYQAMNEERRSGLG